MQKVFITSNAVRNMNGIGKTSGKPYGMNFQVGHLFEVGADGAMSEFPSKFEFVLEKEQKPYDRGYYFLNDSAPYVDRNGNLAIHCRLTALPAPAAK
jgi:hypothetical protein